jgi:prepilin-type N-terminal cleavage/methylation domain-containing protein
MNNYKSKKNNRGFTLVETLVAISILSLSVLATFGAVQNGLRYSGITKDQITAFFLIQEGMEYVKNMRDENDLNNLGGNPRSWLYGMSASAGDPCYFGKTCELDLNNSPTWKTCSGSFGTCDLLYTDSSTGAMGYNAGWTPTTYRREMQFSTVAGNTSEIRLTINVSWTNRGQNKSLTVSQLLYDR